VTPAEAGAILLEEPNWRDRFEEIVAQWRQTEPSRYPIELRLNDAFEQLLREYRRFHFTWLEDGKRMPMAATPAIIALACLRIFPPRSRMKNLARDGLHFKEQIDDHCWLQVAGRAWRIEAIESKVIFLESFGEHMQLDVSRVKWDNYIKKAVASLDAVWGGGDRNERQI